MKLHFGCTCPGWGIRINCPVHGDRHGPLLKEATNLDTSYPPYTTPSLKPRVTDPGEIP